MKDAEKSKLQLINELNEMRKKVESLSQSSKDSTFIVNNNEKRDLQEYLDTILLNLPIGLAILEGEDFRYFRINKYLADINGISVEEHLNRSLAEVLPHLAEKVIPNFRKVLETGVGIPEREFEVTLADKKLHLLDYHFPIGSNAIVAVVVDISKRIAAENKAIAVQKKLYEKNRMASLGVMSSGLAHELSQPMGAILLKIQLAYELFEKNDYIRIQSLIKDIMDQMIRAKSILKSLRVISQDDVQMDREICELNHCAQDVLTRYTDELKELNIKLQVDFTREKTNIHVSRVQIEQVLSNIMSNACDAMENSDIKNLKISTLRLEKRCIIEINDSGSGIEESIQNKIFDPFFTTKKIGKGMGLGLALSYSMIQDNDGDISFKKKDLGGTVFRISFPAMEDEGIANCGKD